MRYFILAFFLSIHSILYAPGHNYIALMHPKAINPYSDLISAIVAVESGNDSLAFNLKEQACGLFQCRPIRIQDYNEKTGSHLMTWDAFDYDISLKVFMYYASQYRPDDILGICRAWNGASKHNLYYKKIIKQLNN